MVVLEKTAAAEAGAPTWDFLLDSVILIDHLNGIPQATEFLRSVKSRSAFKNFMKVLRNLKRATKNLL